jgi:hypothetical protein
MTRTTETAIDRYIQIFDRAAHDPERFGSAEVSPDSRRCLSRGACRKSPR